MQTSLKLSTNPFISNIQLQASQFNLVFLYGKRQYDRFVMNENSSARTLKRIIHEELNVGATYLLDPPANTLTLDKTIDGFTGCLNILNTEGATANIDLLSLLNEMKNQPNQTQGIDKEVALLINSTYLFETPKNPIGNDFHIMAALDNFARQSNSHRVKIFIICSESACIPNNLKQLPYVGEVYIPETNIQERCNYIENLPQTKKLAVTCNQPPQEIASFIASQTEKMTLNQVTKLLAACIKQEVNSQHSLEERLMSIRNGIAENPWANSAMREKVGALPNKIRSEIIGQDHIIEAIVDPFKAAVTGLTDAHRPNSQAPRAKLLLAGSTGVGKTELCKVVARCLYGEEKILRFDCGELSQEHSIARLIGSPPGYVGHDSGGELIEGVKKNPSSLILFDEIEKAHPKIWNLFLGILDDGCVTSGQGERVYLNNCILVFTTNLGATKVHTDNNGNNVRQRSFDINNTYDEIKDTVLTAMSDYFTITLGIPEIEGRFGGKETFIVFDILRKWDGIRDKYIKNCANQVHRLYKHNLTVSDDVKKHILVSLQADENAMLLGGRGLQYYYKKFIESAISDYVFYHPEEGQDLLISLQQDEQGNLKSYVQNTTHS